MSSVLVEKVNDVQIMTIDRAHARNALDQGVAVALAAAVDDLDDDPSLRCGILTGAGGHFSSGMDLKAFLRGETPEVPGRGLCGITESAPRKPLIAAVEGWALAGGFELVLACDLVVAAEGARFGLPEVKRSLVAAGGGALLLPRRVPYAVALEMLLTGDPIDAARGYAIGIVNTVVPDGHALQAALALAERIARNGPLGVLASKRIAREGADWPMTEAWERQEAIVGPVLGSADAREGADAFAAKREPVWLGR